MTTAERADLVVVVDRGRVVQPAPHAELVGRGRRLRPAARLLGRPARRSTRTGRGMIGRVTSLDPAIAARLKRDADGLVPAVVQQHDTREVLMVGWMDDEALHRTLTTGRTTFWSRSRQEYWVKGETSGPPPAGAARCGSTATATPCW